MKASTHQFRRLAAAALLSICTLVYAEDKGTNGATILPDTFGTVVIGDIPGLLDRIGALASKVMPGMNAAMIKQQAGAMLGDPQLEGLPSGSGLALIVPKQGLPYAYLEVSEAKAADYLKLLKQRHPGSVEQTDGLLVATMDQASLASAKELAAKVKSDVLGGQGAPTLSGAVKLAEVLKQYDPQIQAGISGMAKRLEQAEKATSESVAAPSADMVQGVFKFYYAVAKRIEILQLSLEPSGETMAMNYDITPVSKAAAGASPSGPSAADLIKLLPGSGAIRGQAQFDTESMGKIAADILKEVGGDNSSINAQAVADWMKECSAAFGGSVALNLMTDAASPVSGAYAFTEKDEAAALKVLRETPSRIESTGLDKFYASMGMPMKVAFKEKVREYKGVPIHQFVMNMEFKQGPSAQQKRMKELLGNVVYNIASVDKVLLYAVEPEKIDALIDAAKAGSNPAAKPLISATKLAPGGSAYFDYNVGAAMVFAASISANESGTGAEVVRGIANAVKDSPPLQVGWYDKSDHYRLTIQMPAETLHAFVQAGQQASMSKTKGAEKMEATEGSETTSSKPVRSSGPRSSSRTRSRNQ